MSNIFLGCAIWGHRSWVGDFLPAGTAVKAMLQAYSARLTMVEINATFYGVTEAATVARWREDVPEGFRFCPKVPRAISHDGPLALSADATRVFSERMALLGPRLGTVFLQLSPSYGPERYEDLAAWLALWPQALPLAVEVRHQGWYRPAMVSRLEDLLARFGAGRVVVDSRAIFTGQATDPDVRSARRKKPDVPLVTSNPAQVTLVRFMGHPDLAIDQPLIEEWAERLAAWSAAGRTTYMAFHCPDEQWSPRMAQAMAAALEAHGIRDVLPEAPAEPMQLSLL